MKQSAPWVCHGIIPVVAIDNAAHAVPLARALGEGGLHCIEITFRTAAAADALAAIAHKSVHDARRRRDGADG